MYMQPDCLTLICKHLTNEKIVNSLCENGTRNWAVRGILDANLKLFPLSLDTKVLSKLFEDQLTPLLEEICNDNGWNLHEAEYQNQYPDFTIDLNDKNNTRIALDVKSTYRNTSRSLNGMTLGAYSKTSYFVNRDSTKNILFPYSTYSSHLALGIVYDRINVDTETITMRSLDDVHRMTSPVQNMQFFIRPKWAIALKRPGSGNTKNIGGIKNLDDILRGKSVFKNEDEFDEYWMSYDN